MKNRDLLPTHALPPDGGRTQVLDAGLRSSIESARTRAELEDLYLPFKPAKRATKAAAAREAGLQPLACSLLQGALRGAAPPAGDSKAAGKAAAVGSAEGVARAFVGASRGGDKPAGSAKEALQGAKDILAEAAAACPEARGHFRGLLRQAGSLASSCSRKLLAASGPGADGKEKKKSAAAAAAGAGAGKAKKGGAAGAGPQSVGAKQYSSSASEAETYRQYFEFWSQVRSLQAHQVIRTVDTVMESVGFLRPPALSLLFPSDTYSLSYSLSHALCFSTPLQLLAILRGERLGFLSVKLEWPAPGLHSGSGMPAAVERACLQVEACARGVREREEGMGIVPPASI